MLIIWCPAPRSIARCLVISGAIVLPTSTESLTKGLYRNPPRPSYPKELLTHYFESDGSNTEQPISSTLSTNATCIVLWYPTYVWKQPTYCSHLERPGRKSLTFGPTHWPTPLRRMSMASGGVASSVSHLAHV